MSAGGTGSPLARRHARMAANSRAEARPDGFFVLAFGWPFEPFFLFVVRGIGGTI